MRPQKNYILSTIKMRLLGDLLTSDTPSPKYNLVKILGEEGKYFVLDLIEDLWNNKALIKPIDVKKHHLLRVPVDRLELIETQLRTPFDFFLKLVVQGLKSNI